MLAVLFAELNTATYLQAPNFMKKVGLRVLTIFLVRPLYFMRLLSLTLTPSILLLPQRTANKL